MSCHMEMDSSIYIYIHYSISYGHWYIYIIKYVCMYACMHVCMFACMHVWMYGCMDVWMYGCMDVWVDGCMDVWMYGCMDVWMHVCMYACMYVWCMYDACMTLYHTIVFQHIFIKSTENLSWFRDSNEIDKDKPINYRGSQEERQEKTTHHLGYVSKPWYC